MAKIKNLSLVVVFIFISFFNFIEANATDEFFSQGTQMYVSKEYEKARELFLKQLDQDPDNATVLTNLALTEFQLGKKTLAIGLLRKALTSDPELTTAQNALEFALSSLQIKEVPHQIETYETLRADILQRLPLSAFLMLLALTFFAAGWSLISFLGRRKRAIQEEKSIPSIPTVTVLLSLLVVIFTGLNGLKIYDTTVIRGTIIEDKVSLQTAPGENQVAIFDLPGGTEVITHQTQGDWVQITYPGSTTGWIKKNSILMTR